MERLSGIDASFLYMETPTAHMHTIKVAVLRPTGGAPYDVARVKADLRERLHLLPPFRRRVLPVPLGFHHPVWIEDATFDLDRHVRAMTVDAPGGAHEMDAAISAIAGVPLDRRRPLWELWVVDGLAGGRVAAVGKVHHALADGVAVAALLANVMGPGALAPPAAPDPWRPEAVPSGGRLLRDAVRDHVRQAAALPSLLRRTARNLAATARRRRLQPDPPPRPMLDAPRTPFNVALTARRAFASTALPLDDVRRVRAAFGATVNDVLLAMVAGSLRRWLIDRDALPARPLVAEVPVATDAPGDRRLGGNRLSNIFTSLCTDVVDPVERLRAIARVTTAAKELHRTLGPDLYESWTAYSPPTLASWGMRLYARLGLAGVHRPAVNVIVSSVPGPRTPLAWPGGTLEAIYSVGPVIEGAALNFTAWSYVDRLCVGVLACPDLLPDPHALSTGLEHALAELRDVAARQTQAAAPRRSAGA